VILKLLLRQSDHGLRLGQPGGSSRCGIKNTLRNGKNGFSKAPPGDKTKSDCKKTKITDNQFPQMVIEKVTAFITRSTEEAFELLLFDHPHAGIQIPAGTVEPGETPEEAVLREAAEETGLPKLVLSQYLGMKEYPLPDDRRVIARNTRVYARPDRKSFDWAFLRTGITVSLVRKEEGFCQIHYQEFDCLPNPRYTTLSIMGWVPGETLADTIHRHFYHLVYTGASHARWTVTTDHHTFSLFWAPRKSLPDLIHPQNEWLIYLDQVL
jgi:8-oxo-dGTP pyrophosphatase MutT (NUDIX family)